MKFIILLDKLILTGGKKIKIKNLAAFAILTLWKIQTTVGTNESKALRNENFISLYTRF
jgi:hypothetical protein